jgi:predicted nucleotidyltransferase
MDLSKAEDFVGTEVCKALSALEQEMGIHVLFAAESGSRMWGFPSKDSDYDVRFIYARSAQYYAYREYLSRDDLNGRDTVEWFTKSPQGDDLDLHGWDVTKTVGLLKASNPSLHEWLSSSTIYVNSPWTEDMRVCANTRWSPQAAYGHYRSMAVRNYKEYLQTDRVLYKKYLYTIRPILCADYVVTKLERPPMDFLKLIEASALPVEPWREMLDLYRRKLAGEELDDCPVNPVLNYFIEDSIGRQESVAAYMGANCKWPNCKREDNTDLIQLIQQAMTLTHPFLA